MSVIATFNISLKAKGAEKDSPATTLPMTTEARDLAEAYSNAERWAESTHPGYDYKIRLHRSHNVKECRECE